MMLAIYYSIGLSTWNNPQAALRFAARVSAALYSAFPDAELVVEVCSGCECELTLATNDPREAQSLSERILAITRRTAASTPGAGAPEVTASEVN